MGTAVLLQTVCTKCSMVYLQVDALGCPRCNNVKLDAELKRLDAQLEYTWRQLRAYATPTTADHEEAAEWLWKHRGERCDCGYCGTKPSPVQFTEEK